MEGYYKNKGKDDTMNLYKTVRFISNSKADNIDDEKGQGGSKSVTGKKSFKKTEA